MTADGSAARTDAAPSATVLPARRRRKATWRTHAAHRAEYIGARSLEAALRAVSPDRASDIMGAVMGRVMVRTSRHLRAMEHIGFAMPEIDAEAREQIARQMWRNLGRVAGEAFHIRKILAEEDRITFPAEFADMKHMCRDGVIGATPHLGNWEVAGLISRAGGLSMAGVYQAMHNPLMERHLRAVRLPIYPAGLYAKGPKLGATLLALARQGAAVGIVADLREVRGVDLTFFGQPAFATPLPAMLARASGRPLLAGAMVRREGVTFQALMQPIEVPQSRDRERDIFEATQTLHNVFERWIRAYPDQWMWTHRKWARVRQSH